MGTGGKGGIRSATGTSVGVAATTYGAGGGGAAVHTDATGTAGGDGKAGIVIIEEFY